MPRPTLWQTLSIFFILASGPCLAGFIGGVHGPELSTPLGMARAASANLPFVCSLSGPVNPRAFEVAVGLPSLSMDRAFAPFSVDCSQGGYPRSVEMRRGADRSWSANSYF